MEITEKIRIPSDHGYLSAVVCKPNVTAKGLAILLPGYLDSKDYDHLVVLGNDLAKYGYVVIRFDATGTWGSSGNVDDYSVTQRLKDLDEVLAYAQREFRPKKVLLMGHSMGGMIALLYAARHNTIDGVTAIMAPYAFVRPNNAEKRDEKAHGRNKVITFHVVNFLQIRKKHLKLKHPIQ